MTQLSHMSARLPVITAPKLPDIASLPRYCDLHASTCHKPTDESSLLCLIEHGGHRRASGRPISCALASQSSYYLESSAHRSVQRVRPSKRSSNASCEPQPQSCALARRRHQEPDLVSLALAESQTTSPDSTSGLSGWFRSAPAPDDGKCQKRRGPGELHRRILVKAITTAGLSPRALLLVSSTVRKSYAVHAADGRETGRRPFCKGSLGTI